MDGVLASIRRSVGAPKPYAQPDTRFEATLEWPAPAGCPKTGQAPYGRTVSDLLIALAAALPADRIVSDPDLLPRLSADEASWVVPGRAAAAVLPRSSAEVAASMGIASRLGVPVVPRGAGTGLSGGATAVDGCLIVCTERMAAVLELDPVEQLAVVQPGVVTADLDAAAAEHGLWYPPDPSSWLTCTVGGNVATDAGGLCCVRWGTTGAYVLALEVVLADGTVLRTGRRTRKGVAGLDLTSLFVGSEGVLGIVTEATVRLRPRRSAPATVVAVFDDVPACGSAVTDVLAAGLSIELLEVMDRTTLLAVEELTHMGLGQPAALLVAQVQRHDELAELSTLLRAGGALEVHETTDAAESEALLQARRLALPALQARGPVLLDDVCVPVGRLAETLVGIEQIAAETGVVIGTFGHAGDGNLHPTIVQADRAAAQEAFDAVIRLAIDLGGTSTGEHGIGVLKAPWLEREVGAASLAAQRAIKRALDPAWLMNPGKVL